MQEGVSSQMSETGVTTELFLKSRLRHVLKREEIDAMENAIEEIVTIEPRQVLIKRGDLVDRSYYLVDGFMTRYLDDRRGYRQSVGIQVAGDWVDLHSFPMKRLDHDVAALDRATLAVFEHTALQKLVDEHPRLTRIMWFSTLLDAAIHREWVFRLGRLNAEGRIAHLISELACRLEFIDRFDGRILDVPMRQQDFAEASGITAVHANRTFRLLREQGLIDNREEDSGIAILDREGLAKLGEFRPDYLYGEGELSLRDPY
ncbi:Crp/Fnr family transcriptional regulator [Sphingomicrobium sp. XHP0239]|uniref:Crp/Fnr family transcriptional regulator n=1 Tax=Sphingomicrobium maritimum TaxID=3133972 RepID=UPI0031CC6A4C